MKTLLLILSCAVCSAGELKLKNGIILDSPKLIDASAEGATVECGPKNNRVRVQVKINLLPECPAKTACLEKAAQAQNAKDALLRETQMLIMSRGLASNFVEAEDYRKSHYVLVPDFAGVWFRLVKGSDSTDAKFVYGLNLTNKGLAGFKGKVTFTLFGKSRGTVFTKDFTAEIPAGETRGVSQALFTGPSSVHGEASIVKWRIDLVAGKLADGEVGEGFEDEIGRE